MANVLAKQALSREYSLLAQLYDEEKVQSFSRVLSQIWKNPRELAAEIDEICHSVSGTRFRRIMVSGETRSTAAYVFGEQNVLVVTPFTDVRDNVLLKEWDPNWAKALPQAYHAQTHRCDHEAYRPWQDEF